MNIDDIKPHVNVWMNSTVVDQEIKDQIRSLELENPQELYDAFYTHLEFGTGGLRGIMGIGDNRMNKYTVGKATQGFANYLKQSFQENIKVIIAFDCRNNSPLFAKIAAHILAANDISVLLFEELRPTPQLSFLLRHYKCSAGIVCTASHNPKEYNGYKAYWNDGAQLTPPHDHNVINHVNQIKSFDDIQWYDASKETLITLLSKEADQIYTDMIIQKPIHPESIKQNRDIKIVYTPIHGTGITILPDVLKRLGFTGVNIVEAQATPDGNFPTVIYPNPEEKEAMQLGIEYADQINAEVLLGTDPDSDRLAVVVRNEKNKLELLNGNQLALLAFNYVLEETAHQHGGRIPPKNMIIKTIVSSPMIDVVAKSYQCACYNVLTGFKWIAALIREKENEEKFLIGGEESFGLMWGDEARDKDAISASALFCEMTAFEHSKGNTIFQKLLSLYEKYDFYYEHLISLSRKGIEGKKEIAEIMDKLRNYKENKIDGIKIIAIKDYLSRTYYNIPSNQKTDIHLPKSNVLQFELEDGTLISARPSGTEPKIKFYFSVNMPFDKQKDYQTHVSKALEKIQGFQKNLEL